MVHDALRGLTVPWLVLQHLLDRSKILSCARVSIVLWSLAIFGWLPRDSLFFWNNISIVLWSLAKSFCWLVYDSLLLFRFVYPTGPSKFGVSAHNHLLIVRFFYRTSPALWSPFQLVHARIFLFSIETGHIITSCWLPSHVLLLSSFLVSIVFGASASTRHISFEELDWSALSQHWSFTCQVAVRSLLVPNVMLSWCRILRTGRSCCTWSCLLLGKKLSLTSISSHFIIDCFKLGLSLYHVLNFLSDRSSWIFNSVMSVLVLEILLDWICSTSIRIYLHFSVCLVSVHFCVFYKSDHINLTVRSIWSHHVFFSVVPRRWNSASIIVSSFVRHNLVLPFVVSVMLAHYWVSTCSRGDLL